MYAKITKRRRLLSYPHFQSYNARSLRQSYSRLSTENRSFFQMATSCMRVPHEENKIVTDKRHFFAILWVINSDIIENLKDQLIHYFATENLNPAPNMLVFQLDRSCVYISRFGEASSKSFDSEILESIELRLTDVEGKYSLVVCTMNDVDEWLFERNNDARETRPSQNDHAAISIRRGDCMLH